MKKLLIISCLILMMSSVKRAKAQLGVAQIIQAGVKKAIKAIDLKVQRLQNQTIWLQSAQKTIENALSKIKLEEISTWTDKQKDLYKDYFEELSKVKSIIVYYHRIKDIGNKQALLVSAYNRAWKLTKQDTNFTSEELKYMSNVYAGILSESVKNLDQIFLVINSFQTEMSDAQRLNIIRKAAEQTDKNYYDLIEFSKENVVLSLNRAKSLNDFENIKNLYGIK